MSRARQQRTTRDSIDIAGESPPSRSPDDSTAAGVSRSRLILVDGDAERCERLTTVLSERFDLEVFGDWKIALGAIHRRAPDLILVGGVPGIAFKFIAQLRADRGLREIPIIMVSQDEQEAVDVESAVDDTLVEPFSARDLIFRVESNLKIARVRREAVEAVRVSDQRFARFMQHLPGLAWIKDLQGRYVYANDAAQQAFGKPQAELYGRTDEEIFPPETANQFRKNDYRAVSSAGGIQTVETLEQGDGILHYSLVSKFPIPAPDGQAHLVGGMAIDITERKQAEEALRESEGRFRILADSSPVLIWVNGLDGCEFANRTYREFLGVDAADVRGFDWARYVHPDDREAYVGAYLRAFERRAVLESEFRFRRHDGEYRWMRSVGHPRYGAGGEFLGYIGSTFDITEAKQAEVALRTRARQQQAVARLGEVALRERDLQAVFDFATALVAETLQVEYCKLLQLLPDGKEMLLRAGVGWKEGLVGTRTVGTGLESQAGFTLLSDKAVIVEDLTEEQRFNGPPLLGEHGVVSGMSCIVSAGGPDPWGVLGTHSTRRMSFTEDDVSFLVAVAHILGGAIQREQVEEALRDADRRKDEFLATLAHELRNPLAPLRNGLEVMKLAQSNAGAAEKARTMMERQLRHMVRLIDDLLDVSRISRGKIVLRKERVELLAVVQQAVETSRPAIEQGGHELTISMAPEPIYVEADATRLAQVFSNLLNNSAKFTEKGGQIRLAIQRHSGNALVTVRDNGVGIPAEQLPKIFDMFTQVNRSLEHAQGGLGIGLSLVKGLVEMHGGTVEARSEGHGRGSELSVRLPLITSPVRSERIDPPWAAEPRQRLRVLVVDDNRDAAVSLAMVLGMMGNETETAHDGLEAVSVASAFLPDVILLDIGMPKLNGLDAARRVREQPWGKDTVLVAVTGWGQEDDRRRSKEAGFDFHVVKPVDPAALMQLLSSEPKGSRPFLRR